MFWVGGGGIFVHTCMYMYSCMHVWVGGCVCGCVLCMCGWVGVCVWVLACVCVRACVCMCMRMEQMGS